MFAKVISIIGSLTLISRFLGYFRDLLIAKMLGAGLVSDAFFIAFKLPNLFRRLFAEGSMNSAFIPIISGISQNFGKSKADEFFSKIFSGLLVILLFLTLIVEIFMPIIINLIAPGFSSNPNKYKLTIDLSRLTFPFVLFICLTSLGGAFLNTIGKFASMALTPIILNTTIILSLLILSNNENQIYISKNLCAAISIAGVLQLIWITYNLRLNKINLKVKLFNLSFFQRQKKETKKFLILLVPAIIGNGAYQINLLIDMILASTLPDGSISYLYYADRINQLPLGVLGIAISTALLPILSKQIKKQQKESANHSVTNAIKYGIIFSIPSFFGIVLLSEDIVSLLFFRGEFDSLDVNYTANALVALGFGLPAFIIVKILVIPFFANEDTQTPIKVSLFSMLINLVLNLILIKNFQHVGLAIATSVAAWVNASVLLSILILRKKYIFDKSIYKIIFKVLVSSFIMSLVILKTMTININSSLIGILNSENLILVLTIFFGCVTYFICMYMLGFKEFKIKLWGGIK